MNQQISSNWKNINNNLELTISLKNFKEAITTINKIAKVAQDLNHHPNIFLFDYKFLKINIQTHKTKNLTEKDFELAKKIDQILK